ncbi:MAG: transcription termination factor NusA [Eubacteriaceae bacterium]|jgi:N utilization substance protein A|nr:transcription termination factor NusA [Eubacteriaceae bacterium]
MNKEFIEAIDALEKEKGISKEMLFEAIESALISAYKKNYGANGNVGVEMDREEGEITVYMRMDVVDEVEDESVQISVEDAKEIDPAYEVGDVVEYQVKPEDFGRIAAQTAKQVVVQRIREAERGMIFDNYIEKTGEVVTGTVQRKSNETIFVNMGRTEGILPVKEQVPGENFNVNDRIKVYIMDVKKTTKGPQVFLSRSHPGLVKRLFEQEVPEIEDGIVEIKSIAREAGSRTKMAVYTEDENVDPVGACVGTRGSRVQSIVDELFNEKIDIINWSDDPHELISNVLSPAKVESVSINEADKIATVVVPDYQLSLAIGKSGQNVRLAAKLCGWKIDIKSHTQMEEGAAEDEYEDEYDDEYSEETADTAEAAEKTTGEAEDIDEDIDDDYEEAEDEETDDAAEAEEAEEDDEEDEDEETEIFDGVEGSAEVDYQEIEDEETEDVEGAGAEETETEAAEPEEEVETEETEEEEK